MNRNEQGFTLIEVLVSLMIFALTLYLLTTLVSSMRVNSSSMSTLVASQAVQDVLERTARKFQSATYGKLTTADRPRTVAGYEWTVSVCEASVTSNTCVNTATLTSTAYSYTASSTVNLLRMTVTYTPVTPGRGSSVSSALEIGRP